MQYMSAVLLARVKEVRDDGSIVEIVIWQLPERVPPSTHAFKYRLYYGAGGVSPFHYPQVKLSFGINELQSVLESAA